MNTVPCYDRYAPVKRTAAMVGLALGVAVGIAVGLLLALPASAIDEAFNAPASQDIQPVRLPTVVISGKSQQALARVQAERLPTVVVSGRALDGEELAQR